MFLWALRHKLLGSKFAKKSQYFGTTKCHKLYVVVQKEIHFFNCNTLDVLDRVITGLLWMTVILGLFDPWSAPRIDSGFRFRDGDVEVLSSGIPRIKQKKKFLYGFQFFVIKSHRTETAAVRGQKDIHINLIEIQKNFGHKTKWAQKFCYDPNF